MRARVLTGRERDSLRCLELFVVMFATHLSPTLCHGQMDRSNELAVQVGKTVESQLLPSTIVGSRPCIGFRPARYSQPRG